MNIWILSYRSGMTSQDWRNVLSGTKIIHQVSIDRPLYFNNKRIDMWMYDNFHLECRQCWNEMEVQTKVWKCLLGDYYNDEYCPKEILQFMHWKTFTCDKCGKETVFDMFLWRTNLSPNI